MQHAWPCRGAGAGAGGRGTESRARRYWCLGTRHTALASGTAWCPSPRGSCWDHAGISSSGSQGSSRALPRQSPQKAALGTGSWVARDLGSTRRAASLGGQVEGSRSRQTRDNAHTGAGSLWQCQEGAGGRQHPHRVMGSLCPGRAPPEKMAGGAHCRWRQQPGDWRVRALAAAPAARPRRRWQGKVFPCWTLPGAAPRTHGSVPECAASHSQMHGTRTRSPDRRNQNMALVHTAWPGTARHTTPVYTWCQAHGASTHSLAHNACTHSPARHSQGCHSRPTAQVGQTDPGGTVLPSKPSACHRPHQAVPAPAGAALSPPQSGDRGDLHMPNPSA